MSSIRYRDRFVVRVFGYFTLSLLLIAATFTVVFVYGQTKILREQLLEEGRMLAWTASRGARLAVFAEDRSSLDDTVNGLLVRRDVLAVSFLTEDRRVLAAGGKGAAGRAKVKEPALSMPPAVAGLGPGRNTEVLEDAAAFDVWTPVRLRSFGQENGSLFFDTLETRVSEEVIGFVRISMDKKVLAHEMVNMVNRSLALVLVFFLGGSAIVYLLARKAAAPLDILSAEVQEIGHTGVLKPVSLESRGEIGVLAESFNSMLSSLKAREEEKMQLEERLMHAQKMEAIGTLARGIAHDFNNILSTVRGSVHILNKKYQDDEILRKYTGKITISLDRAKELINGLIMFSRVKGLQPSALDLNALVTGLEPTLREIAGDGIRLRIALPPQPILVIGDDLGLQQVLLNLVSNARDAMPDGGELRIAVEPGSDEGGKEGGLPAASVGSRVRLTVADTGTGMDVATQQRIFEPFFTTKEVGRGTGLGLAIVYGIVEQHSGRIAVQSAPGRGTELRIDLPRLGLGPEGTG